MDDDPNCDIFAEVDFGHGPVEIRCTAVGEHEGHACMVLIPSKADKSPALVPPKLTNIFERNEDGHT